MQEKIHSCGLNHTSLTTPVLHWKEGRVSWPRRYKPVVNAAVLQQEHAQAVQLPMVLCTSLHQIFFNQHYLAPLPGCNSPIHAEECCMLEATILSEPALDQQGAWPASCLLSPCPQAETWALGGGGQSNPLLSHPAHAAPGNHSSLGTLWLSRGSPLPDFG